MKAIFGKALLPALAATAALAATPALAQSFSITIGSPGYQQGYGPGYGPGYGYGRGYSNAYGRDLQYRAAGLSQHIERLAYSGRLSRGEARSLSNAMNQYRSLEWRYARNGLSSREYRDLDQRLNRIEYQLRRSPWSRW